MAGRARGRRHRGDGRAGLVSRLAAGVPGAVPRGHGAGLRWRWRFGLRAGQRGCMLQHDCPLTRASRCREAGFMTETTGKICLPCCCAWMPMRWLLTWRPGRWRARRARPAGWPRGDTAGNGRSGCAAAAPRGCGRGGRAAGPAAGPASCCRPGAHRAARTASRSSAPRRAWPWPGTATGPSPPRSASRPGPLRRLRANAG